MKTMMTQKTKFFTFYLLILGLFWIIYILNRRLRIITINSSDIYTDTITEDPIKFGIIAIILLCIHAFVIKAIIESYFEYKSKSL